MRNIDANDFGELTILEHHAHELAITASQIKHAAAAALLEEIQNHVQTLLVQPYQAFHYDFFLVLFRPGLIRVDALHIRQSDGGFPRGPASMPEISPGDEHTVREAAKDACADGCSCPMPTDRSWR